MVFHVPRRPSRSPLPSPKTKYELDRLIEEIEHDLFKRIGRKQTVQLFWYYGTQKHDPLPYGCRLAAPPPDAVDSSRHLAPARVYSDSRHPISAIVRGNMPHRFRQWFLQDDVIVFRTRSTAYLKEVAKAEKKEAAQREDFEKLWELMWAGVEICSYGLPRRAFYEKLALFVLYIFYSLYSTVLQSPKAIISLLIGQITTAVLQKNFMGILVGVISAFVSLLLFVVFTGLQLWCTWFLVFVCVPVLFRLGRGYLRYTDVHAPQGDRGRLSKSFLVGRGYRIWGNDNRDAADGRNSRDHHKKQINIPAIDGRSESRWLARNPTSFLGLFLIFSALSQSLNALVSFWDFHRRTTTGGDGWYRPPFHHNHQDAEKQQDRVRQRLDNWSGRGAWQNPVVQRAEMMETGHLVVCLTPYPDLVTAGWLGWANGLYQSYRAWQRWLLAERVYRELEHDEGVGPVQLGQAMFSSISNFTQSTFWMRERQPCRDIVSDDGSADLGGRGGSCVQPGYSLIAEMSVPNGFQKGKWLV